MKRFLSLFGLLLLPPLLGGWMLIGGAVREANECDISGTTYLALNINRNVAGDHTNLRPNNITPCDDTNINGVLFPPGTISNCGISYILGSGSAAITFTLMQNGVATTITCASSSGTSGLCADTTHTVTVATGDTIAARLVRSSGTGNNGRGLVVNCQWVSS